MITSDTSVVFIPRVVTEYSTNEQVIKPTFRDNNDAFNPISSSFIIIRLFQYASASQPAQR
jgi:hypothetical protein